MNTTLTNTVKLSYTGDIESLVDAICNYASTEQFDKKGISVQVAPMRTDSVATSLIISTGLGDEVVNSTSVDIFDGGDEPSDSLRVVITPGLEGISTKPYTDIPRMNKDIASFVISIALRGEHQVTSISVVPA